MTKFSISSVNNGFFADSTWRIYVKYRLLSFYLITTYPEVEIEGCQGLDRLTWCLSDICLKLTIILYMLPHSIRCTQCNKRRNSKTQQQNYIFGSNVVLNRFLSKVKNDKIVEDTQNSIIAGIAQCKTSATRDIKDDTTIVHINSAKVLASIIDLKNTINSIITEKLLNVKQIQSETI